MPISANRILVFRSGTIGDTIVALPALYGLRKAFPNATLSLLTATNEEHTWTDEVLRDTGIFQEFITYPLAHLRRPATAMRLLGALRKQRADLVIYLASDRNCLLRIWRDRLFFLLAGIRRFRYTSSKKVRFWGGFRRANHIYPYEVDRLRGHIADLTQQDVEVNFRLPISRDEELKAESRIRQFAQPGRKVVGMCAGAKVSAKQWPADHYVRLGDKLIREGGVNIALIGGRDERQVSDAISAQWPAGRWMNLAGKISLLESAALLERCTMYVGNDTGAMHLAAAVGTRCLAIFGARAHEHSWHPYGQNHVVIRKRVPCANCYLSECLEHKLRCLNEISVEEVWASCERMLTFE